MFFGGISKSQVLTIISIDIVSLNFFSFFKLVKLSLPEYFCISSMWVDRKIINNKKFMLINLNYVDYTVYIYIYI